MTTKRDQADAKLRQLVADLDAVIGGPSIGDASPTAWGAVHRWWSGMVREALRKVGPPYYIEEPTK